MKKFIKCFSIVIFSALFAFLLCGEKTSALYDRDENTINISVSSESVKVVVEYQRGFDPSSTNYYWCRIPLESADTYNDPSNCSTKFTGYYVSNSDIPKPNFYSTSLADEADNKTTKIIFTISSSKDPILNDLFNNANNGTSTKYIVFAEAKFCAVRSFSNNKPSGCESYDSQMKYARKEVNLLDLTDDHDYDFTKDIEDPGISDLMDKISNIVKKTVMPVIWAVLGLFLIVKGALLGVQIVKSADEPQVRQEKIGALKWLVIGVAIAYASTGVVTVIISFFDGTFRGGN